MKTIIYSLLTVVLLLPLSVHAQQTIRVQLIGTWVFDYNASFAKMDSKVKAKFDTFSQEHRSRIESAYRGRKININSDGSYSQVLADGTQFIGTWVLNTNNQTLEITNLRGNMREQKIKELTHNALILKPKGIGNAQIIFTELHYTKL